MLPKILLCVTIVSLSCNTPKKATTSANPLNGTWIPVKQEIGGSALAPASFAKQKLIINDSNYTLIAESVDKGAVVCKDDKMDIYGREGVNAGKHFTAIYKLENGQLSICYNLSGNSYPEAFETKGKPGFFLSIFQKEQKQEK